MYSANDVDAGTGCLSSRRPSTCNWIASLHPSFGFFSGFASGDTARQVRCVRGEVLAGVLDHDEEAMHHDSFSLMASRTFGIAFLDDAHSAGWLDKSGSPGFFGHGHSGVVLHLDHQAAVVASTRRISLSETAEILLPLRPPTKNGPDSLRRP